MLTNFQNMYITKVNKKREAILNAGIECTFFGTWSKRYVIISHNFLLVILVVKPLDEMTEVHTISIIIIIMLEFFHHQLLHTVKIEQF